MRVSRTQEDESRRSGSNGIGCENTSRECRIAREWRSLRGETVRIFQEFIARTSRAQLSINYTFKSIFSAYRAENQRGPRTIMRSFRIESYVGSRQREERNIGDPARQSPLGRAKLIANFTATR